jgi:hypothetical protein
VETAGLEISHEVGEMEETKIEVRVILKEEDKLFLSEYSSLLKAHLLNRI